MKAKDIRTIKSLITEYGMSSGASTPTSQQKTGSTAKATAAPKPPKSGVNKPQVSPSSQQNKSNTQEPTTPEPIISKAKELAQDFEYQDEKGDTVKVMSPVNTGLNKDAVVVQNQKNKEFYTLDPEDDITLPGEEQAVTEKSDLSKGLKRKQKIKSKIKRLIRAQKYIQQGDPIFEINFNSPKVAKDSLNANIRCGFEAETVWEGFSSGDDDEDFLYGENWSRVQDLIYDQEGSRSVDHVNEAFREWLQESEKFYEYESEVIAELVEERKEDERYIEEFIDSNGGPTEGAIEQYKDDFKLNNPEEYENRIEDGYEYINWVREYVEEKMEDELIEWLEQDIRDNGEQWDEAWDRALSNVDEDDWCNEEYSGNWHALLGDLDIFLYNNSEGSMEEVADQIRDWAGDSSISGRVEAGDYHSGQQVDNDYWRVEDDSSIEGDGMGAEIISPVYDTPTDMLAEMKSLFSHWSSRNVDTNRSTGLHVTMSMAGDVEPVNKLKIALLLGDKYLLQQFNRDGNSYTKSQVKEIQQYMQNLSANYKDQKSLSALEDMLKDGISAGKFSSINFKDATNNDGNGLIEFRIAGGDSYHRNFDMVAKTTIRYAATMLAGHDENVFREDYIKALFRFVNKLDAIDPEADERASSRIDPEHTDKKVVDAFKSILSKQHYTDAIDALATAYNALARSKRENAEESIIKEEESWNDRARDYSLTAFGYLLSSIATGKNRNPVKVQQIGAFRQAMKDFGFTPDSLYKEFLASKQYVPFLQKGGSNYHDGMKKFADAFNSTFKVKVGKAPVPDFTVKYDNAGDVMYLPLPYYNWLQTEMGNKLMPDAPIKTPPGKKFKAEDFKVIDRDEHSEVYRALYNYNEGMIDAQGELKIVADYEQELKELGATGSSDASDNDPSTFSNQAAIEKAENDFPLYKKMWFTGFGHFMDNPRVNAVKLARWINNLETSNNAKQDVLNALVYNKENGGNPVQWDEISSMVSAYKAGGVDTNESAEDTAKAEKIERIKDLIVHRKQKAERYQEQTVEAKIKIDAFSKKHGFLPYRERDFNTAPASGEKNPYIIGTHQEVDASERQYMSQEMNIRFSNIEESNNVFTKFNQLTLKEQLSVLSKVDATKINEALKVSKKKKSKGFEHPNKSGKKAKYVEGAVPDNSPERKIKQLLNTPMLASDLKAQMEAYFVIPDPSMIKAFREAAAAGSPNTDLRSIFKGFVQNKAHPVLKKKVGITESKLKEDDLDRDKERFEFIIDKLKDNPAFIQRVYRFMRTDSENQERVHPEDFLKPEKTAPEADYNYKGVLPEFVKAIMNTKGDFDDIENFLSTYGQVSYVDTKVLMADGSSTWDQWLKGSGGVSTQFITELYDNMFNIALNIEGSNRGPGEVGLALLAPNITFASVGDLKIDGVEVEVKGEKSSGGGRLKNSNADYGQPNLNAVYDKFKIAPEDRPQRLPSGNAGSRAGTHFLDIATQLDTLAAGAGQAYIKELFEQTFINGDKSMIAYIVKNYASMDRAESSTLAGEISYSSYANILKAKQFDMFLFLKLGGKKSLAFQVDNYKNHLDKFKLGSLDWGDKMNGPAVQVSMR